MTPITFRVVGDPKAQPRPRAFARKFGDKYSARVYDAGTAEGWKSLIAQEVRPLLPPVPLDEPLRLDAAFLFDRPQRLLKKSSPVGRIPHDAKPDRDNLEKALLDCLTQSGLLKDDCKVCAGEVQKFYAAMGERPGVEVRITPAIQPGACLVGGKLVVEGRPSPLLFATEGAGAR